MENKLAKDIIKKYDNILVEITSIPHLFSKNIICVQSFKDLLNVKKSRQKPIYYISDDDSYDFLFLEKDVYIYTIKGNNIEKSLIEKHLDSMDKSNFNIIKKIKSDAYVTGSDGSEFIVMPLKDENEKTII